MNAVPGDLDRHGHLMRRVQQWRVERNHLTSQLLKQKAKLQGEAAAVKDEVRRRRQHLEHDWRTDDAIQASKMEWEAATARQEQCTRDKLDTDKAEEAERMRRCELNQYAAKLERHEQGMKAIEELAERQADRRWSIQMATGVRERTLANLEEDLRRERAKRGFRWAQSDLKHKHSIDHLANAEGRRNVAEVDPATRLPTTASEVQAVQQLQRPLQLHLEQQAHYQERIVRK